MTIIVGYLDAANAHAAIAADSIVATGGWMGQTAQPHPGKVWKTEHGLYGMAGSSSFQRWWLTALQDVDPTEEALVAAQVAFRRDAFADGHGKVNDDGTKVLNAYLIAVSRHGLFKLDCDGGVMRMALNYTAIGSGTDQAMGALYVLELSSQRLTADEIVSQAVEATKAHALGIGGRTLIHELRWTP